MTYDRAISVHQCLSAYFIYISYTTTRTTLSSTQNVHSTTDETMNVVRLARWQFIGISFLIQLMQCEIPVVVGDDFDRNDLFCR